MTLEDFKKLQIGDKVLCKAEPQGEFVYYNKATVMDVYHRNAKLKCGVKILVVNHKDMELI